MQKRRRGERASLVFEKACAPWALSRVAGRTRGRWGVGWGVWGTGQSSAKIGERKALWSLWAVARVWLFSRWDGELQRALCVEVWHAAACFYRIPGTSELWMYTLLLDAEKLIRRLGPRDGGEHQGESCGGKILDMFWSESHDLIKDVWEKDRSMLITKFLTLRWKHGAVIKMW